MFTLPDQVIKHNRVLMIGCGGGYDIYVGLPFYFALVEKGIDVDLANFSFTSIETLKTFPNIGADVYKVDTSEVPKSFFPEAHLSRHILKPVYAIAYEGGVIRLEKSYQVLIKILKPTCIILVDGGCDSLMFGREDSMGTWVEDSMNIYVANKLIQNYNFECYLLVGGATADFYEGIKETDLLNNIQVLRSQGNLIWEMVLDCSKQQQTQKYVDIFLDSAPYHSIVNTSIVAAVQGIRGFYSPNYLSERIKNITLNIADLTATCWLFDINGVANNISYLHLLEGIDDSDDIEDIVDSWREKICI